MGAVSILRRRGGVERTKAAQWDSTDWVNLAAGSALVASGMLLLTGKRRAGLAVGTAGAALALLQHEDTVRAWWSRIPAIVEDVQNAIGMLQDKVNEITARRSTIEEALGGMPEEAGSPTA